MTRPSSSPHRGIRPALFWAAVLLLGVAGATAWWHRPQHAGIRRAKDLDVLLITVDTLRADALGAYGNTSAQTPWMDRLASSGVRFDSAHAQNVVTLPSHANILSGRYPFEHGVRDNAGFRFPRTVETLATLLKARGYRTGAFVSAFPLDSRFGLNRGFDVYDDAFVGARAPRAFFEQERSGVETVARARRWLDAEAGSRTFCWVHIYEPHYPYQPPEPFAARFGAGSYAGEVAAADAALGPLLDPILTGPAGSRTLVVLTADHGESLGEHGEATHGIFAYESTLRVPLILYQPRLWSPAVVSTPARHVDLLPTVLDAIGLPVPEGLAGRSLLGTIAGEPGEDPPSYFEALSASFTRGWAPLTGVIRAGTKYIDLPIGELYELKSDPAEQHNLAETAAARVAELGEVLAVLAPPGRGVAAAEESRDTRERLRSLGYLGAGGPLKARYDTADDPKQLIDLDGMLQQVVTRYLDGDVPGALERCRQLVARRPSMAVSQIYLAQLERESGNLPAGIAALRQALALNPGSGETLALLGAYLAESGEPAAAAALLDGPAKKPDADPQLVVSYALALAKAGRHKEGLAALAAARQGNPDSSALLVESGTIELMAGNRASARQTFEAALARNPDIARAHSSLGVLAAEDGRQAEAFEHWRSAVALDPKELEMLLALGTANWRAGRAAAARPYLQFFIEAAPPARYGKAIEVVHGWLRE